MKLTFPSRDFDDAVAAVCHGTASEDQLQALHGLLRTEAAARDEYLLRVELHSWLASESELHLSGPRELTGAFAGEAPPSEVRRGSIRGRRGKRLGSVWTLAMAAALVFLAVGFWVLRPDLNGGKRGATSKAVALLNRVVDAQWEAGGPIPKLGAPLEPGWIRVRSGLVQVVFYSGARVVLEGPAELQIISPGEAFCPVGRLVAEVPPEARGFRVRTPDLAVTDLGTSFGLAVQATGAELHVFQGSVQVQSMSSAVPQVLPQGAGVAVERAGRPQRTVADAAAFGSLFALQAKSAVAEAKRYDQWRLTARRRQADPSLRVHFDFEHSARSDWQLQNVGQGGAEMPDATIVGGQWVEGRWPAKPALEFQRVGDRVRMNLPGEFESLTLAAWVRVQGLDRQINSLFMSDGFAPGTVHWSIRDDGVLGFTVIGPGEGEFQIVASSPVLTLDQLGSWLHLAVVLDGEGGTVTHYVNGRPVGTKALRIDPPFQIGVAELGNWNASGFPGKDPFLIRNFSGAMDEFYLFSRALNPEEMSELYREGRPQAESGAVP
ncbi:MAG: hypothetical protein J0M24_19205 [Verrucomicrobia bacterium]|nr:hypothetical protein [Verrucomicrobiota bacterium]